METENRTKFVMMRDFVHFDDEEPIRSIYCPIPQKLKTSYVKKMDIPKTNQINQNQSVSPSVEVPNAPSPHEPKLQPVSNIQNPQTPQIPIPQQILPTLKFNLEALLPQHLARNKNKKGSSRKTFSFNVRKILNEWFQEHISHPYLTRMESEKLQRLTGLTSRQLAVWFTNQRIRKRPLGCNYAPYMLPNGKLSVIDQSEQQQNDTPTTISDT